jgi:hypothetical protein
MPACRLLSHRQLISHRCRHIRIVMLQETTSLSPIQEDLLPVGTQVEIIQQSRSCFTFFFFFLPWCLIPTGSFFSVFSLYLSLECTHLLVGPCPGERQRHGRPRLQDRSGGKRQPDKSILPVYCTYLLRRKGDTETLASVHGPSQRRCSSVTACGSDDRYMPAPKTGDRQIASPGANRE